MASTWYGSVTLIDDNEKKTTLRVNFGSISDVDFAAEAAAAEARMAAYIVDLKAISLANVYAIKLIADDPGADVDAGVPSTGSDVSEELALICHTNDSLQVTETDVLRVPSPVDTVWVNDNYDEGFDLSDSLAAAYVANFASDMFFSDGENVNTSEGTNGISSGFWRSRKMQIRK